MQTHTTTHHAATELYRTDRHPRLFLGPDELPAMRERAGSGFGADVMSEILQRCARYTDPASEAYVDSAADRVTLIGSGQWGSPLNPVIHALGFAAAMTGEERWLDPCARILATVARGEPVTDAFPWPFNYRYDAPEPICIATLSGHLPLVYDLIHDMLPAAVQEAVGAYLRRRVVEPYFRSFLTDRHKYALATGVNPPWHELYTWAWSLAAVYEHARAEDRDAMRFLGGLVRRALHLGLDEQGTIGEGPGYGSLDAYRWLTCAAILRRAGVCDLWAEEPQLSAMMTHWTYLLRPDGGFLSRSDTTGRYTSPLWPMLIHARYSGSPVAQWTWERYGAREQVASGAAQPVDAGCPGFYLIWDRPDADAQSPDRAGWPRFRPGGRFGEHIWRSGWGADDFVCSVLAGGRQYGCYIHQHADAGHLSLYALGEAFGIEAGYGDKRPEHHTLLRPVGSDCSDVLDGFEQAWHGGATLHAAATEHGACIAVDAARMWRSLWNYRHVFIVDAPGTEPYLLVLDNVNQGNDWGEYEWTLNTHPDNRVTLDRDASRAEIQGSRNRLECVFATFGAGDYPRPHTLTLATDELTSHSFGRNPDGSERVLGIGRRPRLLARLAGYNGAMLAALLPRRAHEQRVTVTRDYGPYRFALTLDHGGGAIDTVVASPVDRFLDHGAISGEALAAVVRRNAQGAVTWWGGIEIASLTVDGAELLPPHGGLRPLATARANRAEPAV